MYITSRKNTKTTTSHEIIKDSFVHFSLKITAENK